MVIVEIGGTVGDIESLPFLEAVRQFRQDVGRDNALFVHLALVPYIATAHELKTKPMQHSVRELRAIGIQPRVLLCRTDRYLSPDLKAKLALYCDVPEEAVITAKDVDSIYEVPLVLSGEGLDAIILKELGLRSPGRNVEDWERLVDRIKNPKSEVTIGIVGKYVSFEDSYKSLNEALSHGGFAHQVKVVRRWVESEELESANAEKLLAGLDGILVPGGFGARGTGGMVAAAEYARRTGTPYFGICYGFQWMVTEYARNVCGLEGANSTEVDEHAPHRVIYKLQDLLGVDELGGTMRLGAYECALTPGSLAAQIYGATAHQRAAPPPLRVQQGVRGLPDPGRARDLRQDPRRQVRGDRRAARPPVLHRGAVPPGVQVEAARTPIRSSPSFVGASLRTGRSAGAPRRPRPCRSPCSRCAYEPKR